MYRIDHSTGIVTLPPPTAPTATPNRYFTGGTDLIPTTILEDEVLNMWQEELCNAVTGAGLVLNKADRTQLHQAIIFHASSMPEPPDNSTLYFRARAAGVPTGYWTDDGYLNGLLSTAQITTRNGLVVIGTGYYFGRQSWDSWWTLVENGASIWAVTPGGAMFVGGNTSPWHFTRGGGYQNQMHAAEWYEQYEELTGNRFWVGNVGIGPQHLMTLSGGNLTVASNANVGGSLTATGNVTAHASVYGGYLYSYGNCDVAGNMWAGGTVTATGGITTHANLMVGGGIMYVANNWAYYFGRSNADGVWRIVDNGVERWNVSNGNMWLGGNVNAVGSLFFNSGYNFAGVSGVINTPQAFSSAGIIYGAGLITAGEVWGGLIATNFHLVAGASISVFSTWLSNVTWPRVTVNGRVEIWDHCFALTGFSDGCDSRGKRDIQSYTRGLAAIRQLNPRRFRQQHRPPGLIPRTHQARYQADADAEEAGLVAQDVESIIPEAVTIIPDNPEGHGDPDAEIISDRRYLHWNAVMATMINAIKELDARLQKLEAH